MQKQVLIVTEDMAVYTKATTFLQLGSQVVGGTGGDDGCG